MKYGHCVATAFGQPMLEMAQRKQYQYNIKVAFNGLKLRQADKDR